ncbi:MAG: hypothetical protein HY875_00925 [Chloroflexi bacterium]|nr:hypothetical protein [Chloroflexota bacterium]
MVREIRYDQQRYTAASACLEDLRVKVERGWQVSSVARSRDGSYDVVFRLELDDGHVAVFAEQANGVHAGDALA